MTMHRMSRLLGVFVFALFGGFAQAPAQSGISPARQATNVAIITIKGEMDGKGVMLTSVKRRMDAAVAAGADAIVFELDTPGGSVKTTLSICSAIKSCPIQNTVAWINPDAYSGGAVIALACREIIVNDPCNFGDAMPILRSELDRLLGGGKATNDTEILRKILPPLIAEVTDSARRYNNNYGSYLRDEYLVQAIIANDVELWFVKNKATGLKMCIDRREFEMLFPGADTGGATRLANAPGLGKSQLPPGRMTANSSPPNPNSPAPLIPAGSAKLALAAASPEAVVASPTLRPVITPGEAGKWELIGKVKDDTLPAVFKAGDMLFYGLCANETQASACLLYTSDAADE